MSLENLIRGFKRSLVASSLASSLILGCSPDSKNPNQPTPIPPPPTQPPPNRAPVFLTRELPDTYEGKVFEFNIQAFDPDGDPISYSIIKGPQWIANQGSLFYGVAPLVLGETYNPVTFRLSDGKTFTDENFILTTKNTSNTYIFSQQQINNIDKIYDDKITFHQPVGFSENDIISIIPTNSGNSMVNSATVYSCDGIKDPVFKPTLRKITIVSSDKRTISTIRLPLEEIVQDGRVFNSKTFNSGDVESCEALVPGVSLDQSQSNFDFNFKLDNVVLYDRDRILNTKNDQVTVSGKLSLDLGFFMDVEVKQFSLKRFEFKVTAEENAEIFLSSSLAGFPTLNQVEIFKYRFRPITIGTMPLPVPIPITVFPVLSISAGINPSQVNPLSLRVTQNASIEFKIIYDGSWTNTTTPSNNFTSSINNPIFGDWNITAFLGPQLKFSVYDMAGPLGGLNAKLRLHAQQEGGWKLYGGLEAYLGASMEFFGRHISGFAGKVWDEEKLIAENTLPPPNQPQISLEEIVFSILSGTRADIYKIKSDAIQQSNLTNNPSSNKNPTISFDRKKIAFSSNREGANNIYIMDADGSNQRRVTSAVYAYGLDWSPIENKIAFHDNNSQVYVIDTDGSNKMQLSGGNFPSWSQDGNKMAFQNWGGSSFDIYTIKKDGSGKTNITNTSGLNWERWPSWSPDGKKIAYVLDDSFGNSNILIINPDGTNKINLTNNLHSRIGEISWSPIGDRLIYLAANRTDLYYDFWIMNSDGSGKRKLTTDANVNRQSPGWSK